MEGAPVMRSDQPPFGPLRFVLTASAVVTAIVVLIARLYYLQVVRGDEFRIKSESNFVQLRRATHDRGSILDRAGRVLVDNRPAQDVYLTPAFVPDSFKTLRPLGLRLGIARDRLLELDQAILAAQRAQQVAPIVLAEQVAPASAGELLRYVEAERLPGILFEPDPACPRCQRVLILPDEFPSQHLVLKRLAEALGVPSEALDEVRQDMQEAHGLDRFLPIRVARDVSWDAFVRVDTRASLFELPGVDVQHSQRRRYRMASLGAHVLGYINEVGREELKQLREDGYRMGDVVGRAGLERSFERELRGIDGVERVVVDAMGRRMDDARAAELLGDDMGESPQPGNSLVLSIDAEMQQVAEHTFAEIEGRAGAVVAVEAKTGFILAMASVPAYDPNMVSGKISPEEKRRLDTDRLQPWINKAIQQQYPPGSTFKVVTAVAGARAGVLDTRRHITCPGAFRLGRAVWRCWNLGGHGSVELHRAIQKSCDVFFYTVGFDAGIDALAEAAHLLGFGSLSGIDLRHEVPGLIADRPYYERRPDGYQKGYVVNNSIGQGDISVTPLQLALAYAAIGNGGTLYAPQLVREIRDHEGNVIHHFDPAVRWRVPVDPAFLQAIQGGLSAVLEQGGTAYGLFWRREPAGLAEWMRNSGVALAGKTGTAQVVKMGETIKKLHELDYWERDHAWFAAYAPADDPEIAVAVINEHSGHGGSEAAPIAGNVIRAYFERVRSRELGALERSPGADSPEVRVVEYAPQQVRP
ncbi:MAG: penicillin-binding protein 2 [Pseudomonadota bacterium]